MNIYVVTGSSKGLGAAIIQELMDTDAEIHCISRTHNPDQLQEARKRQRSVHHHSYDLARHEGIEKLVSHIISMIPEEAKSITLINNAGVLHPIAPIGRSSNDDLERHMQVNLIAPLLLTSSFIRYTSTLALTKTILNISSGAGKKPYQGWGAYCSAKAGLDMLTRCVGAEQEGEPNPVKIVSLAPGVIDTDMQELIRATPEQQFPHVGRFVSLKREEKLQTPDETARRIVRFLQKDQYEQGAVLDLRDLSE